MGASHPSSAPGVDPVSTVSISTAGPQVVCRRILLGVGRFFGPVIAPVIFPGMSVIAFSPVFTLAVFDVRAVYKIDAGCIVAVVPAFKMRRTIITGISAPSIGVAVISGIIQVLVSRAHRFIRIAFGLRGSALGFSFTPLQFGFPFSNLQPCKLKLLLPFSFNSCPVRGLVIR